MQVDQSILQQQHQQQQQQLPQQQGQLAQLGPAAVQSTLQPQQQQQQPPSPLSQSHLQVLTNHQQQLQQQQQQPQQLPQQFRQPAQPGPQKPLPAGGRGGNYSRKDKSLGLLCDNFLRTYEAQVPGQSEVCLDEAASRLQVERRRIYDIVNVLESVEVVTRRQKNSYTWNGLDSLQQSLAKLQAGTTLTRAHSTSSPSQSGTAEALSQSAAASGPAPGETWGSFAASGFQMQQQGGTPVGTPDRGQNASSMTGFGTLGSVAAAEDGGAAPENGRRYTRKDKSLGLLSQRFIQLFLSTRTPVIALDDAAVALRAPNEPDHEALDPAKLKTKVRRLYDIANVLSSLRLLDKTQLPDSRKPAFRWRGCPAPGEVSAALAAGAGGARTPNDHLRALIDGAASEASHGADTGSPASASGSKRSVAVEQTNGHLGKRSRAGFVNAMTHSNASLPPRMGGSGSYSPPETPTPGGNAQVAAGPNGEMQMTSSPSAPGSNSDQQGRGTTPAADSQTGPPPLAVAPAQTPQQQQLQAAAAAQLPASPMPPGFMAGMPFPGMLPLPPMLPPGMQAAAGMPGVVPPQFTAAMMQQMQQLPGMSAAVAAVSGMQQQQQQQQPPANGAPAADANMLQQQMVATAMQFWQCWAAYNQTQQQQGQQQPQPQQGPAQPAGHRGTPPPQQPSPDAQPQAIVAQAATQPTPQQLQQTVQQHYQPGSQSQPLLPAVFMNTQQQLLQGAAPGAATPSSPQFLNSIMAPAPSSPGVQAQQHPQASLPMDITMADAEAQLFASQPVHLPPPPHQIDDMHMGIAAGAAGGAGPGAQANGGSGRQFSGGSGLGGVVPAMAGVSVAAPAVPAARTSLGARTNSGALAAARTIAAQRSSSGSPGCSSEPHLQLPLGALPMGSVDHMTSSEVQSYPASKQPSKLRHSSVERQYL